MSRKRPRSAPRVEGLVGRTFVDSGAWLAFFSASDDNHGEADALFRRAVERRTRLVTTNLVLAEVHRLLLFRAGRRAAEAALTRIVDAASVSVVFATVEHHKAALVWLSKKASRSRDELRGRHQLRRDGGRAVPDCNRVRRRLLDSRFLAVAGLTGRAFRPDPDRGYFHLTAALEPDRALPGLSRVWLGASPDDFLSP